MQKAVLQRGAKCDAFGASRALRDKLARVAHGLPGPRMSAGATSWRGLAGCQVPSGPSQRTRGDEKRSEAGRHFESRMRQGDQDSRAIG